MRRWSSRVQSAAGSRQDTFQEVDQVALFAPICKRSIMVTDPARLAPMLEDATVGDVGRRGPVVLHVPRDLFAADIPAIDPGGEIAKTGPPLR